MGPFDGIQEQRNVVMDRSLAEIYRQSEKALKLAEWSMSAGHRLAYFALGVQTVVAGYILYRAKEFSSIPTIPWFFILLGVTIFLGLLWLVLYSFNLHHKGFYLARKTEFDKWATFQVNNDQLSRVSRSQKEYEEIYNSITENSLLDGEKHKKKADSKLRLSIQIISCFAYIGLSMVIIVWLAIVGFIHLKNEGSIPEQQLQEKALTLEKNRLGTEVGYKDDF